MADADLLRRKLRMASVVSLASGLTILCVLSFFFPTLRDMVPPPAPPDDTSPSPSIAPSLSPSVAPSASSTIAPTVLPSYPLGDDGQLDWPAPPNLVDPNPPPAPGDKR